MNIIFDIETVPVQDPAHIATITADCASARDSALADVKAPSNYKDADKIAAFIEAERTKIVANFDADVQAAIGKTSFDGGMGQIVCIGWAIDDGKPMSRHVEDLSASSERELLAAWFHSLNSAYSGNHGTRPAVIGHNHISFDIPFLWKRAMVHNVKPPIWFPRNPKPWSDGVVDTMTLWDSQQRAGGSMERLCRILGIPGKQGMSGADVWPMVQAGKLADVAEYCRGDVERTRAMFRRMTFAEPA